MAAALKCVGSRPPAPGSPAPPPPASPRDLVPFRARHRETASASRLNRVSLSCGFSRHPPPSLFSFLFKSSTKALQDEQGHVRPDRGQLWVLSGTERAHHRRCARSVSPEGTSKATLRRFAQRPCGPPGGGQRAVCFSTYKYFNASSALDPPFQSRISFTLLPDRAFSPAFSNFLRSGPRLAGEISKIRPPARSGSSQLTALQSPCMCSGPRTLPSTQVSRPFSI